MSGPQREDRQALSQTGLAGNCVTAGTAGMSKKRALPARQSQPWTPTCQPAWSLTVVLSPVERADPQRSCSGSDVAWLRVTSPGPPLWRTASGTLFLWKCYRRNLTLPLLTHVAAMWLLERMVLLHSEDMLEYGACEASLTPDVPPYGGRLPHPLISMAQASSPSLLSANELNSSVLSSFL